MVEDEIDDRRDRLLLALTRLLDLLERGRWPSGDTISNRERRGLERTILSIRDQLRDLPG